LCGNKRKKGMHNLWRPELSCQLNKGKNEINSFGLAPASGGVANHMQEKGKLHNSFRVSLEE